MISFFLKSKQGQVINATDGWCINRLDITGQRTDTVKGKLMLESNS